MRSTVVCSLALASFVAVAAGCSGSSSPAVDSNATTRVISGAVVTRAYALDNAVVIATSDDGRRFIGAVESDGTFRVTIPTGASYRLALANSLRGGAFEAIAAISWTPGTTRTPWMQVSGGGALAIGNVRPSGASGVAVQSGGSGGSGGESEDGGSGGGSGKGSSSGGGDKAGASGSSGGSDDNGGSSSSGSDDGARECQHAAGSDADLPYDVRPGLGSTFKLSDAFLAKGPLPAAVLGVTMDKGSWRLAELVAGTPFTITQADCDHDGNRSIGRDRVVVTWQNADGSTKSDHLDLRYCDGSSSATPVASTPPAVNGHDDCEDDDVPTCTSGSTIESECDGDKNAGLDRDDGAHDDDAATTCPPGGGANGGATGGSANGGATGGSAPPAAGGPTGAGGTTTTATGSNGTSTTPPAPTSNGGTGSACTVTADCAAGLLCVASTCIVALH